MTRTSIQRRCKLILFITLGLTITFVLVINFKLSNNVKNTSIANINYKQTLIDGIVIISAGKAAKTDMGDKLINSLLFQSSLSNSVQIYLLTDHISCFNVSFYSQFVNVQIIEIEDTDNRRFSAKLHKTKFFSYLPSDAQNILYLDNDIKANQNFNEYIIPTITDDQYNTYKNCSLIIQRERQITNSQFNSGTFVVNRYKSEKCMNAWNYKMVESKKKFKSDQAALNDTKECTDNICFLPDNIVVFSKHVQNLLFYNNIYKMPLVHYTAIMHGTDESISERCKRTSITDYGNGWICTLWKLGLYPSLFLHTKTKNFC